MYCRNCGREISEQSQFCEYCGTASGHVSKIIQGPLLPNAGETLTLDMMNDASPQLQQKVAQQGSSMPPLLKRAHQNL
ncbi:MAG: zinc ribbon domain-containing protein [Coriobacteriales bacterium]|jgi:hypothetical protein|nr:zinc ribbon domain-containing protein [Coriobacteriales bacterium]